MKKRLLAAIMAMMLAFTLAPAMSAAEEESADWEINNAYRSEGDFEPSALSQPMGAAKAAALPSSYSSVEQGYLTQVKDQNPYGTCWTFAAMAASEADAIKNEGADASSLDLSELHLAYFTYSEKTDLLGGLDGDSVAPIDDNFLEVGGNNNLAISTLSNWIGAAEETTAPYGTAAEDMKIDDSKRFLDKFHLKNAYVYALPDDAAAVKKAIMDYGAAATMFLYDASYGFNDQYLYQNTETIGNHAVTIVGWDDTISKTLFNPDQPGNQPKNDGAWLIRNSWSSRANQDGYFWLSYEDTSIDSAAIYDMEGPETYDRNYQYDGGVYSIYFPGIDAASNVFTAKYNETLKAVGVTVGGSTNAPYEVKIYKNPKSGEPDSGTLVSQASGTFGANGFYTIELDTEVPLIPGDRFSVVIDTNASVYVDADSYDKISWFSSRTTAAEGQSYLKYDGKWEPLTDMEDKLSNFRIKAFTVDREGNVGVTGISLPGAAELSVGGKKQLTANIQPSNATNKDVKWSSSDSKVATVSADGVVSGLAAGTAVITARTYEGNYSASCTVTIKQVGVSGISLDTSSMDLLPGQTKQLAATVLPANAANKEVSWSSSNPGVAEVSANGLVTAKAVGTAVITATTANGAKTASCTVTVHATVSGISLSEETATLAVGQTKQLAATVLPANAANKEVSWSSSNPGVAEVSANGLVTAKAVGTAVITATTADGAKTASCTVTVTAKIGTARTVGAARVKVTGAGEAAYTAPKSKTAKSAVIPATVKIGGQTYKVTSVAANAFKNNKRITKVTIGKNVKTIGTGAFRNAAKLKTVTIPSNVKTVGASAFRGCTSLTKAVVGRNVKTIGKSAFYGCSRLSRVTIGKNVKTIGDYAFYGNKRLKTVSLPASVKSIGKSAFRGCTALTKITLGRNVTKIGTAAFYGDKKLKTIVISSAKLKSVGKQAFKGIYTKAVVKAPKSRLSAYKKLLKRAGLPKKARIVK